MVNGIMLSDLAYISCKVYFLTVPYAEGKGHNKWVGLVGVLGILGLIVLVVLPDQRKEAMHDMQKLNE